MNVKPLWGPEQCVSAIPSCTDGCRDARVNRAISLVNCADWTFKSSDFKQHLCSVSCFLGHCRSRMNFEESSNQYALLHYVHSFENHSPSNSKDFDSEINVESVCSIKIRPNNSEETLLESIFLWWHLFTFSWERVNLQNIKLLIIALAKENKGNGSAT